MLLTPYDITFDNRKHTHLNFAGMTEYKGGLFGFVHKAAVLQSLDYLRESMLNMQIEIPDVPSESHMPYEQLRQSVIATIDSVTTGTEITFPDACSDDMVVGILGNMIAFLNHSGTEGDVIQMTRVDQWSYFLVEVLKRFGGSYVVVLVGTAANLLLRTRFSPVLVESIGQFSVSDDDDLRVVALRIVEFALTVNQEQRWSIISNRELLTDIVSRLDQTRDQPAIASFRFLRRVFFFCSEERELTDCIDRTIVEKSVLGVFRHLNRLRTTTQPALKLLRTICMNEPMLVLAVSKGLVNTLLRLMTNELPAAVVKPLFDVLYPVVTAPREAVRITDDERLFSRTNRFLRCGGIKGTLAVLNVVGALLIGGFAEELNRFHIFDTCIDIVVDAPAVVAKLTCSMLSRALLLAGLDRRREIATNPRLIKVMCRVLDGDCDDPSVIDVLETITTLIHDDPDVFLEVFEREEIDAIVESLGDTAVTLSSVLATARY